MWRIRVEHLEKVTKTAWSVYGTAYKESIVIPFYVRVRRGLITLSTSLGAGGQKLITDLTKVLGEPESKYRERRGTYEQQAVEWNLYYLPGHIIDRVVRNLAKVFKLKDL